VYGKDTRINRCGKTTHRADVGSRGGRGWPTPEGEARVTGRKLTAYESRPTSSSSAKDDDKKGGRRVGEQYFVGQALSRSKEKERRGGKSF